MSDTAKGSPSGLFQAERQREILALALENERVEVSDLAERFGVTTETVRRDLSELQERRLLRRVHGGAVSWEMSGFEPLLSIRNSLNESEKRRIAHAAVQHLPDNGTVIIDSGSTLARLADAVPANTELRVVTNSLYVAQTLAEHDLIEVTLLGGKLRTNTMAVVDGTAARIVSERAVDTLFISSDGLSIARGLTTPYEGEATLKRAMITAARRVIALVDHTKFHNDHFIQFADWADIDLLITTTEADPATIAEIERQGTSVVQA